MEKWFVQSIWIAMFGFLKEFRPEDPYITQYMSSPPMNFTTEQVCVQHVLKIENLFFKNMLHNV